MASIFTKIINREIPGYIVAESDTCLAFLDIFPLVKGHVLVVPKQEVEYIYDLEDGLLKELHVFAKKVAKGIEKVISCERVGVAVVGLEVPHAHIHLVPLNTMDDLNFTRKKLELPNDEMASIAQAIKEAID
ncbi:MAG: HIT family protein [Bacteroidota bacterium]